MRFQEAADQGLVRLYRHASLLVANSSRFLQRVGNIHDASRRAQAHRPEAYSPECVEGKFCELRLDGVLRRSTRSEEHTSELQSRQYLVCRLLLEKKKQQ